MPVVQSPFSIFLIAGFDGASHDINTSEQLPLTLSVADWIKVLSLTRMIKVQSLQSEELVNDLRAYIEGSIKKIGSG